MSLSVKINGDASGFTRAVNSVKSGVKDIGRHAMKIGVGMAAAGAASAVAIAGIGVKLALMGEGLATAEDRIKNVNKQMGLFGGESDNVSKRMIALAKATSVNIGVDAKSIMMTQAKLSTFAELAKTADQAGGAFDRATMAALDMASAGFGDAESNAVQLGKALQDPIRGIAALGKSGVTFTAQEREKIRVLVESNKMLAAQEMILKAVERQVVETAAKTANGSDRMKVAFSLMLGEIGKPLAEISGKFADVFVALIPAIQAMMEKIAPIIKSAGSMVSDAISDAVAGDADKLANIGKFIGEFLVDHIKAGIVGASVDLAMSLGAAVTKLPTFLMPDGANVRKLIDQDKQDLVDWGYENTTGKVASLSSRFEKLRDDNNGTRFADGFEFQGAPTEDFLSELKRIREESAKQTKQLEEMNRNLVPAF